MNTQTSTGGTHAATAQNAGQRAAIFDMYGTLVNYKTRGRSWREVLASNGIALEDAIAAQFASQAADGTEHIAASRTQQLYTEWEKQRIAAMIRAHKVPGDITALVDEVHREWLTWTMAPYPEVPGMLANLRASGVRIVVCTNWTWDASTALRQAGLLGLVDAVVVSAQAGARKPHPRIFQAALAAAGTQPENTVFIGDDWNADVLGSLAAGMSAVHIDRQGTSAAPLPPQAHRLKDLRRIPL